jgi:hypothetical protein
MGGQRPKACEQMHSKVVATEEAIHTNVETLASGGAKSGTRGASGAGTLRNARAPSQVVQSFYD